MQTVKSVTPELVFHAPFDGSAVAAVARGGAKPLREEGIEFVSAGRRGGAARFTSAAKSVLEYARAGNIVSERGTVVMRDHTAKCVQGDASGLVRLRGEKIGGRAYFYAVNTGFEPAKFTLRIPAGAKDLVTGAPVVSGEMSLDGYELRSFAIGL